MLIRTFCTRDSIRGGGILSHSKYCSLKTSKLNERTSPSSLWNLNIRLSILHKHVQAQKNCRVFNLSYTSFHKKFLTKKISLTSLQTEKHHFTYKIHWDPPVTQKYSSIPQKLNHQGSWKPRRLGMSSFFSPLNLPIWLKRYSLQFAVGMDNIPPQMDSLEHMGNTCQTNLHIPHAAVFSLSWSPSCLKTVIHSINPTLTPCLSEELYHYYHHCGIILPSVSPVN